MQVIDFSHYALFSMRYCIENDHPLAGMLANSLLHAAKDGQIKEEVLDDIEKEAAFHVSQWERWKKEPNRFLDNPIGSEEAGQVWTDFADRLRTVRKTQRSRVLV